MFTDMTTWSRA
jgi:hypothetical protein